MTRQAASFPFSTDYIYMRKAARFLLKTKSEKSPTEPSLSDKTRELEAETWKSLIGPKKKAAAKFFLIPNQNISAACTTRALHVRDLDSVAIAACLFSFCLSR